MQDKQMTDYVGLTDKQVEESQKKFGTNELKAIKKTSFWRQFLANFGDPIIKILLISLAINIIFMCRNFDWFETIGIALAIFLATFVSTISEYGSEQAFSAMQKEAEKVTCRVIRNKKAITISVQELVVDDILLLQAGEKVPADGIVIDGKLLVDQSALNGESREVKKIPSTAVNDTWDLLFPEQVFRGSVICGGEGVVRIGRVGEETFYGHMAKEVQEDTRESPLRFRLNELAKTISRLGYVAAIVVAFAYLFNVFVLDSGMQMTAIVAKLTDWPFLFAQLLDALTLGITVIVVAVPEGLPMMITVVLSSNMKRMLKDKVLVRKLVGIETSGSLNVLLTDKTGTLTEGKPSVQEVILADGMHYTSAKSMQKQPILYQWLHTSAFYNTSSILSGKSVIGGNATDRAILSFFAKTSFETSSVSVSEKIPFDSQRKFSSIRVSGKEDAYLIKGAPEKIVSFCHQYMNREGEIRTLPSQSSLMRTLNELTAKSVRVIAVAMSDKPIQKEGAFPSLTFLCFFAIADPIRREAPRAIDEIQKAGIQVIMITGDNKNTAIAVAKNCHLLKEYASDNCVLTSDEMGKLSDESLTEKLPYIRVIARALPTDKSRLVRLAQAKELVVGMTGDGVNDAPALKKADVGFAMGGGTEVAKEAGDIVILDNNISSIEKAILYGRTIFKSIRKFIIFQLMMNLCAVGISIIGPFVGIETPVTVIQMLWVNMIMDTLGGLAFAGEAPLTDYMKEKPKKRNEKILNAYMVNQIVVTGCATIALCLAFLLLPISRHYFCYYENSLYFMTAFFALFIFCGIFNCFNTRTHRINLFANLRKNKMFMIIMSCIFIVQIIFIYKGGTLFRTTPLYRSDLFLVIFIAALVIPADLLRKFIVRACGRHGSV